MECVQGGDNLAKGVQCYELFGEIALKITLFYVFDGVQDSRVFPGERIMCVMLCTCMMGT